MSPITGREGEPLPRARRSREFTVTEYDVWQERQRQRNWTLNDVPFYKGKGQSIDQNPFDWHDYDYLEYYDQVFGRKCGSAGIGKLREVGLVRVSEHDDYGVHPYFLEDPDYLRRDGHMNADRMDVARLHDQQCRLAEIYESHGITVYWIEYPERPMAAFGPMTNLHSAAELTVLPGGSVIGKKGYALAPVSGFGRTEYLGRWAFWNLGIPVLLTIIGKGTFVRGVFLADDVYVQAMSVETNHEAMDQLEPVMRRACGEDLHIQKIYTPGATYGDRRTGISAHTDMVIMPLDIDKALVYPAGLDVDTCEWLWRHGYTLIEAAPEEQMTHDACNGVILEPGLVLMHREASETIKRVRAAGVEVIAVDYSEYNRMAGGMDCATMQILRDPGPRKLS